VCVCVCVREGLTSWITYILFRSFKAWERSYFLICMSDSVWVKGMWVTDVWFMSKLAVQACFYSIAPHFFMSLSAQVIDIHDDIISLPIPCHCGCTVTLSQLLFGMFRTATEVSKQTEGKCQLCCAKISQSNLISTAGMHFFHWDVGMMTNPKELTAIWVKQI